MTPVIQGFLLGLANGGSCLTVCAPVLLPYLVGEGRRVRSNILSILYFLGGRLAGYLVFAVFAWEAGKWIRSEPRSGVFIGAIYAALALILVLYGFSSQTAACAAKRIGGGFFKFFARRPAALPASMGLLTGLTLCPPFIAAFAGATNQASIFSTLLYFSSFFVATSLYVAPFPFAGLLGRSASVRIVGRLAAGVMGCYFFYKGLIMIYGGLQT
jgi:sulfite exporter TauE/SafE